MSSMTIVLVEDNYPLRWLIVQSIQSHLPDARIWEIGVELEFRNMFAGLEADPPKLFILDMRFPYVEFHRPMPPIPKDVTEGGGRKAGLRCWKQIRDSAALRHVPVLFHSGSDMESSEVLQDPLTQIIDKDVEMTRLLNALLEIVGQQVA